MTKLEKYGMFVKGAGDPMPLYITWGDKIRKLVFFLLWVDFFLVIMASVIKIH